jgi:hypothetical protein
MAQKPFVPAVYDSFVDAIGNTPVILLKGASERTGCKYVRTLRSVAPNLFVVVAGSTTFDTHTIIVWLLLAAARNTEYTESASS